MVKTGVIILAHGSRGERGLVEVPHALQMLCRGVKPRVIQGVEVIWAAMQFNRPNLEDAIQSLIAKSVSRVIIMPYFLFSGRHITEDIPGLIESYKTKYPEIELTITKSLGFDNKFVEIAVKRILEYAPEIAAYPRTIPHFVNDIEKRSMEIIDELLPGTPEITQNERSVVKRIVHACGDPDVAHLIRFSQSAIGCGLQAISRGCTVYTDVRMVAAGVNRNLAEQHKCYVKCSLDEIHQENDDSAGITRSAAAIRNLGTKLNDTIVVIGNAPTALLALLELIDKNTLKPALVIGMPVGFVNAKESKEELIKRDVPYITVTGTRGGSAMAVATVNALLRISGELCQ